MKCPVCTWEHPSMLCPRCGFDSSRDYEKYPSFGIVEKSPAVSALRKDREEQQRPVKPEIPTEEFLDRDFRDAFGDFESLFEPEVKKKPRKKRSWLAVAACAATLAVGIWTYSGLRGGTPAELGENVQMQVSANTEDSWLNNILMPDTIDYKSSNLYDQSNEANDYFVLGSSLERSQILSVTFLDTLADAPADAWDVSAAQDGSVMAWVTKSYESDDYLHNLFIGAEGGINANYACKDLFSGYVFLETIKFGNHFHTEQATDMSRMFLGCDQQYLTMDLTGFDTSNVTNMYGMFAFSGVKSLDLRSFNTAQVENMSAMFQGCYFLDTLKVDTFDTSCVTNMRLMFSECISLTTLDLSSFDTSAVQDMDYMFNRCPAGDDWQHLLH